MERAGVSASELHFNASELDQAKVAEIAPDGNQVYSKNINLNCTDLTRSFSYCNFSHIFQDVCRLSNILTDWVSCKRHF